MVTFSERVEIAEIFSMYVDNVNKNNSFTIDKDPLTFMSWLESNGLLNAEACKKLISLEKFKESLNRFTKLKDCT